MNLIRPSYSNKQEVADENDSPAQYYAKVAASPYAHILAECYLVGPAITGLYLNQLITGFENYRPGEKNTIASLGFPERSIPETGEHVVTVRNHQTYED
jgi:hypothetical protein